MTEAQFQAKVIRFLKDNGAWLIKYWGGSQFTKAGIPDLLCCVNGHFIAIELKTEKGLASKLQEYNIDLINQAGGSAMILRPSEFEAFKSFIKGVKGCNLVIPEFPPLNNVQGGSSSNTSTSSRRSRTNPQTTH